MFIVHSFEELQITLKLKFKHPSLVTSRSCRFSIKHEWVNVKTQNSRLLCVMHDHRAMKLLNNLSERDKGSLLSLVLAFHYRERDSITGLRPCSLHKDSSSVTSSVKPAGARSRNIPRFNLQEARKPCIARELFYSLAKLE